MIDRARQAEEAVLAEFLDSYFADQANGAPASLDEYVARFPGYARAVAREFLKLEQATEPGASEGDVADSGRAHPARIGPYEIIKEIGHGGQAVVYVALDPRLNRSVAVKVLAGWDRVSPGALARFKREAEASSKIDDPGICQVFDTGTVDGSPYIAMQYVKGQTMADAIKLAPGAPRTAADVSTIVSLIEAVARSLHAAHEVGVIHRDIKPANIMVTIAGRPVILDFGLAGHLAADGVALTQTGDVLGTPAYMSPEQVSGLVKLDRRTDVWSLGVTLYEGLTHTRPFDHPTREGITDAIRNTEPLNARSVNRAIGRDLATVISTAIAKQPYHRYDTTLALAEDLKATLELRTIKARRIGPIGRISRFSRRRPAVAILLSVLFLTLPTIAVLATNHVMNRAKIEASDLAKIREETEEALATASYTEIVYSHQEAISLYETALLRDPGSADAAAGLAFAYIRMRRPDDVLTVLRERSSLRSHIWTSAVLEAEALRLQGEGKRAEEVLKNIEPRDAIDYLMLGRILLRTNLDQASPAYGSQAVEAVTKAVMLSRVPRLSVFSALAVAAACAHDAPTARKVDLALRTHWPDLPAAHFYRGYALQGARLFDDAVAAYREVLRLRPDLSGAYANLGNVYYEMENFDAAITAQRKAIELFPKRAMSHNNLGNTLLTCGRLSEAVNELKLAVDLDPGCPMHHANLANVLFKTGDLTGALAAAKQGVALDPRSAHAQAALGLVLALQGKDEEAVAACQKAIEGDPTAGPPHLTLAQVFVKAGRVEDGIREMRKALDLHLSLQERVQTLQSIGRTLAGKGGLAAAIAEYQRAADLDPKSAVIQLELGTLLMNLGKKSQATEALRKAISLDAKCLGAYSNLGMLIYQEGRVEEAADLLQRATTLAPTDGPSRLNFGTALQGVGRFEEAIAEFEHAIALGINDARAHFNCGVVYQRSGRFRKSQSAFKAAENLAARENPEVAAAARTEQENGEEFVRFESMLDEHLKGAGMPEDPFDGCFVALVAAGRGMNDVAVRMWERAFEEQPNVVDGELWRWRDLAARAAIIAASQGSDSEARRFRMLGLQWLQGELAEWTRLVGATDSRRVPANVRWTLARWKQDAQLAPVRESLSSRDMPSDERTQWESFWESVGQLCSKVSPLETRESKGR